MVGLCTAARLKMMAPMWREAREAWAEYCATHSVGWWNRGAYWRRYCEAVYRDRRAVGSVRGCKVAGEYPSDWEKIAVRVKLAADWKCEHCGHEHDVRVGRCLTVHHLDGNKSNCERENLVALCQVCHLHIQARYHPAQLLLPGIGRPFWMYERGLGQVPENTAAAQPGGPAPDRTDVSGTSDREGADKRLREAPGEL